MEPENQAEPVDHKKWMGVLSNTSITVSYKANQGMFNQRMSMALTPDKDCLPDGISIPDSVVVIKSGAANKINVLIVTQTSQNIQLDKNTYLGNVEINKLITSLQVKSVSVINKDKSIGNINNTKNAEAVTPIQEIPSQDKPKYSLKLLHWMIIAVIVH